MLNLKAYTGKDLSNFLSMLNQMEQVGVTEIRWMREKIATHLHSRFANDKKNNMRFKFKGSKTERTATLCPSCGNSNLRAIANPDGLMLEGCPKCRYSRIKEKILGKIIK